jgi:DNA-binding response OmpR family regulator
MPKYPDVSCDQELGTTTNNTSAKGSNTGPDHKARVLVVDDDVMILRFLRTSLTLAGYDVVTATGGEEALRLQESAKPSIMLLDILMPVVDGFEVLRRLRAVSELPVVAFSAHASAAEEALRLGANDFLSKPFRPDEVVKRIEALLSHKDRQPR